jgi:hypothetical protein
MTIVNRKKDLISKLNSFLNIFKTKIHNWFPVISQHTQLFSYELNKSHNIEKNLLIEKSYYLKIKLMSE